MKKSQNKGRAKSKDRLRNREFAWITYFFVILFIALMGYLVYFTVARAGSFVNSPYNQRQDAFAKDVVRGAITDRNGNVLAQTNVAEDGSETRYYPYGSLFSHVVGYSDSELGKTGLESVENFELLTSNAFFVEKIQNEFNDAKNQGDTVVTPLDADLQQAASDAMGDYRVRSSLWRQIPERYSLWYQNRILIQTKSPLTGILSIPMRKTALC